MKGSEEQRRMLSYFLRLDYNYDHRYLAQVNFRTDGCSKFGLDNRRGYFPSFSLGWHLSNEAFWQDSDISNVFNSLKLRGSWGKSVIAVVGKFILICPVFRPTSL